MKKALLILLCLLAGSTFADWPATAVSTTNLDSPLDSAASARIDLYTAVTTLNQVLSSRSSVNGVAALDATGKVPVSQLPVGTTRGTVAPGDINFDTVYAPLHHTHPASDITGLTLIPPGAVVAFATPTCPSGWLFANGATLSRTTYSGLFTVMGTYFGSGDGTTTFAIPDLRGYFVRGVGVNGDGTGSGTYAVKQQDAIKTHSITFPSVEWDYSGSSAGIVTTYPSPASRGNATTQSLTYSGALETRPRNIALYYCVKY